MHWTELRTVGVGLFPGGRLDARSPRGIGGQHRILGYQDQYRHTDPETTMNYASPQSQEHAPGTARTGRQRRFRPGFGWQNRLAVSRRIP